MLLKQIIANIKVWHFFLLALLFAGSVAILDQIPANDVVNRYAPAAEAFARGDWHYAFHPRFGVFFTGFSGIATWLLGTSGANGCKIISVLFFALSVFPLNKLFQMIWGKQIALIGTLLYIFCSHLLRYAGEGVRDNGKTLALALIACGLIGLYRYRRSWKFCVIMVTGAALLTVIRGEGALIAVVCGIVAIFLVKSWRHSLASVVLYLFLISPQLYYNLQTIGYSVPELRHGVLLKKWGIPPLDAPVKIPETAL